MSKRKSQKKTPKKKRSPQTKSIPENGRDRSGTINIRRHFPTLLICLVLVGATLTVYSQVRNHDFIYFDDDRYITENRQIQEGLSLDSVIWAFTSKHVGNWHPLTWLSYMLDSELYGLNAKGYLLTNVLLHIVNTVLLFLLLRRLTGALWQSGFVAALFALHPLHVESVAWVSERKDVLSTLFWMLTLWAYFHYVEGPGVKRYLIVLLTFALGLMAKPMLVTLPFVLLLLDYWPLQRIRVDQIRGDGITAGRASTMQQSPFLRLLVEKTPFFALTAASCIVTFLVQRAAGSVRALDVYPIKIRLANALVSYVRYIGKMIWPRNLAVLYPHPGTNIFIWQAAAAGLFLACITLLVIRMVRRYPYLAVGWLWYLGTLVPVIGLVQVGVQAMADRYTYVPLIGLFIMIAWGIPELVAGWRYRRIVLSMTAGSAISAVIICSWLQVQLWENSLTLFEHTLSVTDNNYLAHNSLGVAIFEQGKLDEAIVHYTEALRIKPDYAKAHYNLGLASERQGRLDEAIVHYSEALRIKPDYAKAHNNLGVALARQGRLEEAISHYYEALQISPDYFSARYNLADALAEQGRIDEAIVHFSKALSLEPNSAAVHYSLGGALDELERFDEAIAHYTEAVRINPKFAKAHNNLAIVLAQQGRLEEAIFHFSEALRLDPNLAERHNNLGIALAQQGRLEEATFHFSEALRLKPDYAQARNNLDIVLQEASNITRTPNSISTSSNGE